MQADEIKLMFYSILLTIKVILLKLKEIMKLKKVFITGVAGFMGSNIAKYLLEISLIQVLLV